MTRIEELFHSNFELGYFSLIDKEHPLSLYIGLNEEGQYSIEYQGDFRPLRIKDSSAISVRHYKKRNANSIMFSLKDSSILGTFCVFCEDLVDSTRSAKDNESGYSLLVNRFYSWRKMFNQGRSVLDEKRIMGLIGELLFLKDFMFRNFDKSFSIYSWTGSEKLKKDFSLDNTWYEIKSIHSGKDSVTISSFEQLDSEQEGHLIIYSMERMSPEFYGVSLNKLVKEVHSLIDTELIKDVFLQKMSDADYSFDNEYDDFVYDIKNVDSYSVTNCFPCIHKTAELDAVSKIQYELILSKIEHFKEK